MAGQAQKKAAKAASSTANFYGAFLLVVNVVYFLWLASHMLNGAWGLLGGGDGWINRRVFCSHPLRQGSTDPSITIIHQQPSIPLVSLFRHGALGGLQGLVPDPQGAHHRRGRLLLLVRRTTPSATATATATLPTLTHPIAPNPNPPRTGTRTRAWSRPRGCRRPRPRTSTCWGSPWSRSLLPSSRTSPGGSSSW